MERKRLTDEEVQALVKEWTKNVRINQSLTFYLFVHTGWSYVEAKKYIETGKRPD